MSNAVIFAGTTVKTLKSAIALKNESHVASGADDPSVVGFEAPLGSIYLQTTGSLFVKTGALDTDWLPSVLSGSPSPLTVEDSSFEIVNDPDNTKKAVFDVSGVSTSTTRTFSLPDDDGQLVLGTPAAGEVTYWSDSAPVTVYDQTAATSFNTFAPTNIYWGQPFTATNAGSATGGSIQVSNPTGTYTGTVQFRIYASNGSGVPDGNPPLATTSNIDVSTFPVAANSTFSFSFTTPVSLVAGTEYVFIVHRIVAISGFAFRGATSPGIGCIGSGSEAGPYVTVSSFDLLYEITGNTVAAPSLSSEAALSPERGGTGAQNDSTNTISFSGNFPLSLTLSASTSVTLPSSGTLATLAGSESLTNKAISASNASLSRLTITSGSGGSDGWIELQRQSAVPNTPTNALKIFNDNDDELAWILPDGFTRKLVGTVTGNRVWTFPDEDGTVALLGSTQTFTGENTFDAAGGEPVHFRHGVDISDGADALTLKATGVSSPFELNLPASPPAEAGQSLVFSSGTYDLAWQHPGQQSYTAGETLAAGEAVYVSVGGAADSGRTAGRVYKTDASLENRSINFVGLVVSAATSGNPVSVKTTGWTATVPAGLVGDRAYLSATTPGGLTSTLTAGQYYVPVGVYNTTTTARPTYREVIQTEFRDSFFTVLNTSDQTKRVTFSAAPLTTGSTRTLSFPDHSGVIATLEEPQTFLGLKTFSVETIFNQRITLGGDDKVSVDANGTAAEYTIILPDAAPTEAGQALTFDTGTYQMAWKTPGALDHTAGENLFQGEAVYISPGASDGGRTAGRVYKAEVGHSIRGRVIGLLAQASATTGGSATIRASGRVNVSSGGTAGEAAFLDPTTPGGITTTKPVGSRVQFLGVFLDSANLDVNIGELYDASERIGEASIGNNVSIATSITDLSLDSSVTRAAHIKYSILRTTATDETSETGTIRATYLPTAATWLIDNTGVGGSGVTFSITSAGQVQYTSDDLTGASYSGDIKWRIEEFEV